MTLLRYAILQAFIICCGSLNCHAQSTPCTLKIEQLPEVRGFKLGMSIEQIRQRYPHLTAPKPDPLGYAEFEEFHPLQAGAYESDGAEDVKSPLEGIDWESLDAVKLEFLDGRLVTLKIYYDGSAEWRGVGEFLNRLAATLKLPGASAWVKVDNHSARLDCDKFFVMASIRTSRGHSGMAFVERGIGDILKKREKEEKDHRREIFTPD